MSDPNDNSIPVLHEILVPGQARSPAGGAVPAGSGPVGWKEPGFKEEPVVAPQVSPQVSPAPQAPHVPHVPHVPQALQADEPALAPQPVLAEAHTLAPEPVIEPSAAPRDVEAPASAAGVFDRAEPAAPLEAGSIVPPDIAHETAVAARPDLDAEVIAERLRGRLAGFLTGDGRGIIEARCRDALQEHTTWLVSQITREVALTLETELSGWVREAVEEEIARRAGRG